MEFNEVQEIQLEVEQLWSDTAVKCLQLVLMVGMTSECSDRQPGGSPTTMQSTCFIQAMWKQIKNVFNLKGAVDHEKNLIYYKEGKGHQDQ